MTTAADHRVSLTPRAAEIAKVARDLLETDGLAALSMRNIAGKLGIRAASLYEHFADKRAVENAIMAAGMWEQGDFIAARVAAGKGPKVFTIAQAFRDFALEHPELYRLIMSRDLDRDAPDVAAAELYAGVCIREEVGEFREVSLALWSYAHGMADLELNHRYPPGFDVDAVWQTGLVALHDRLLQLRAGTATPLPSKD
ncbi:MAG: TetR/AcrR family transcriptional regulator [Patulibacter sp.]|nr:TetR/AcrR family transcriptional regulator [Patulibacter sp.]